MQFCVYIVLLKCLYFSKTLELIQANTDMSVCVVVTQSCLTLCNPMVATQLNATPWTVAHQAPRSMETLQARMLEWVAMPSSRESSQPRHRTQFFHIVGRFFTVEPPGTAM